jgi:DNA-binding MarR family transcriptional regulator
MPSAESQHAASLIYVIGRVNQGIRRRMRTLLAQWSLSVQEFTALSVLSSRPKLSNAQLARRALVTPQAMIEILSKLESRGLVRREVDPAHGRILRAELTPEARKLLREAEPAVLAIQEEMLAAVPDDDRAAALRAMGAAMVNLSGS